MKRNYAFTLTETLITLVILGIISAITIPTIIANHQKHVTAERAKKIFSTLAQTTNRAISDNGPIVSWSINESSKEETARFTTTYLLPYLNVMKDCGFTTKNECEFKYKTLTRKEVTLSGNHYRFILNDGTLVGTVTYNDTESKQQYTRVFFDINGGKGPNIMGRDVFILVYMVYAENQPDRTGTFLPYGYQHPIEKLKTGSSGCSKNNSSGNGYYCLAIMMKKGWQITEDYPW